MNPSFQKCGKLPTLTDQWLKQPIAPPKKIWSKTAPEKMLKSKKSGWTTCYVLYVKIICIFEFYHIYIYQEYIGSYFSSYQRVDPRLTKVADVFSCNTPLVGKCTRNGWMNVFTERMKWKAGNCSTAASYRKSPPTTPGNITEAQKNTHTHTKKIQNLTGEPKLGSNLCNKMMLFATQKGQWETMPQGSISRSLGLLFRKALERLQTTLRSVPYVIDIQ